jgi:hypothetical protein
MMYRLKRKNGNHSVERMITQTQAPSAHVGMLQLLNGAHVAGAVSCLGWK